VKNILVTGGAGFIGSNFIHYLFENTSFDGKVINVDKLTYAGNLDNLGEIPKKYGKRYFFEEADIIDYDRIIGIFERYDIDTIVHFAAESHVDRSIIGPSDFVMTNVLGTFNLLEVARKYWSDFHGKRFHHVSTDEVYGSLGKTGYFFENTAYNPRSPYSASKASSDHFVRAYFHTYGLPVSISNCSNNYGPRQFTEKLIPFMIKNMLEGKPLPIYGDGKNIRDWLYVDDHCSAIWLILNNGNIGEIYNIGGECELENMDLLNILCEVVAKKTGKEKDHYKKLISFVKDRPGHDKRYAINCNKIKMELGWKHKVSFEDGIKKTVDWYLENIKY